MTPNEYSNRRYHQRKSAGLCPRCGGDPRPGGTYCTVCTDYFRERWQRNAQANRAAGLCRCGAPTDGVHKMCKFCRRKQHLANQRWLEKKEASV